MCTAAPLSLEAALSVVGALECVVRRCVGPEGGSVLFTKDTGETLITRHGQRILTALHLDHPIARTVLECVGTHVRVTSDGSKSFILLLAALLRGIRDSANRRGRAFCKQAYVRKLANQLLAFACNELDDVVAHNVVPYTSGLFNFSGCELEGGVLAALVDGYIAGRVGPGQAAALSPVLCEFYSSVSQNEREAVAFLDLNFSRLCIAVSGLPSSCSHLVEGLVLDCNWSVWREIDGPAKALVVYENLDAPSVCAAALTVRFQEDWIVRSECVLRERLAPILGHANVLLSSVKQSERVLDWAGRNGISVLECCDSGQLDLLCELTNAETVPLHPPARVAPLTRCRSLQTGGCRRLNLGVPPYRAVHAYTLVLCAPTPGALEQSVSTSRGVFGMLRHLREQPDRSDDSHPPRIHSGSQTPQSCCDNEQPRGSCSRPPSRLSTLNSAGVVPVGGAFEFLLHRSLSRGSNHGDESRRLLAEAVLSVPESLHSHKPRCFLQHRAGFMTKLQLLQQSRQISEKFMLGATPQGAGSVRLEPVCSKHQLVASVLQCVNRLLCVGTILHTHTSLHRAHASVSEDSEDEQT